MGDFIQLTGFLYICLFSVSEFLKGMREDFLLLSPSRVSRARESVQFALSNGFDARNRSSAPLGVETLPPFDGVLGLPRYLISFRMSSGFPHAR